MLFFSKEALYDMWYRSRSRTETSVPKSIDAPATAHTIPVDRQLRLHYSPLVLLELTLKCSAITDTEFDQVFDTGLMNVSASTALNRHEHIIVSPRGFLSRAHCNYEVPYALYPFDLASAAADTAYNKNNAALPATMLVHVKSFVRSEAMAHVFNDVAEPTLSSRG